MRELAVYYCQKCGYYGYYQLPKNAVCPKCDCKMVMLSVSYQDFMNLDCKERDDLLAREILETTPSIVQRLVTPHKEFNTREIIAAMSVQIQELETENKKLNETVGWMHKTIWDLLRKGKDGRPIDR